MPPATRCTRLAAAKQVLDEFLSKRKGDRVGVVVFGNAAFTLVPFTTDLDLSRRLLQEMQVGMAGPRTALGDAIGLGVSCLPGPPCARRKHASSRSPTATIPASQVPPAEAARVARDHKITIHTVAVGDPAAAGEDKLDEGALKDVADVTGGGFYRALDRAQLADIYSPARRCGDAQGRYGQLPASPRTLLDACCWRSSRSRC